MLGFSHLSREVNKAIFSEPMYLSQNAKKKINLVLLLNFIKKKKQTLGVFLLLR